MADLRFFGASSNLVRFVLMNSSTGQPLTGLSGSSSGLIISTICDVEATATAYTASGSTIQTIATLGTFAAPTSGDCRFAQVDATNHPGLYEFQFADARLAISGAKRLVITVSGATNLLTAHYEIELVQFNPFSGSNLGLTALPTANPGAAGGVFIAGTNAATTITSSLTTTFTGNLTGSVASVTGNVGGNVVGSVGSVTAAISLPSIPTNWLTAAGIASGALDGKGDWLLSSSYTAPNNSGISSIVSKLPTNNIADETLVIAAANSILSLLGSPEGATVSADIASLITAVAGLPTGSAVAGDVMDSTVETGFTLTQILQLMAAVLLGQSSGVAAGSPIYRDVNNTTNRVSATASNGDRSSVTLNPS